MVSSCKKIGLWYYVLERRKKAGEPMSENKTQQELDFERKHEQDLQRLRGLRLIDDDFMAAVLKTLLVQNFCFKSFSNERI